MTNETLAGPTFPSELDPFPSYLTHYFERAAGPFRNICDLPDAQVEKIRKMELASEVRYSRFKIWPEFMKSRRTADDLLIKLYEEKFSVKPARRPAYAVLGDFHRIPGLFPNPESVKIDLKLFGEHEVTFMYPDHAHLIQLFRTDAPPFGHALPADYSPETMPYYGRLFTLKELKNDFEEMGINQNIKKWLQTKSVVHCYVEAHIWTNDVPQIKHQ